MPTGFVHVKLGRHDVSHIFIEKKVAIISTGKPINTLNYITCRCPTNVGLRRDGTQMGLFSRDRDEASSNNKTAPPRWKIASFDDGNDGKKAKRARKPYSLWSAMKYTMILSILLWWLPVFGQMIAGYIGGRKAGGPWRGLIAAILPVVALFAVITTLDYVFSQNLYGTGTTTTSLLAGFTASMPIVGPYLDFTREYVSQFVNSLAGTSPYGLNSYVITLAFAYIGGILADQTRREIEAVSGSAGSRMTVVVAQNDEEQVQQPARRTAFLPAVTGIVTGRNRFWSSRNRHTSRVTSFDQMVPEEQVYGERYETEMVEVEPKRRKVLSKRTRKVRGINSTGSEHHRSRPNLRINSHQPKTMKVAAKRIEREWDPEKRRRNERTPVPHQHQRFNTPRAVDQPAVAKPHRRPVKRSWETI